MTTEKPKKAAIRDSFMYKHGFSILIGFLVILSILTTTTIVVRQQKEANTDFQIEEFEKHIRAAASNNAELSARIEELAARIAKLEKKLKE